MKKILPLIFLISLNTYSQDELKILTPRKKAVVKNQKRAAGNLSQPNADVLTMIQKQGEKTNELLGKYQNKGGIWDYTNEFDFKTGTVIRGRLLNSVVSTNLESPLLVEVESSGLLPEKTLFSCKGITKYARVLAACNKLIIPDKNEEYKVQVGLLNLDGSSGLRPDEVYTGKEEYVAATVATAFSKGLIELKTERLASPLGELTANTAKNRLTNGLLNSLDETSNIMKDEMQSREPKVYIGAGRSVLIYFYERFKL